MLKNIARVAAVALIALAGVVACSDDQQACAAPLGTAPRPNPVRPPKANPPKQDTKPGQQRTTSKVQDAPKAGKTTTKPKNWSGYDDRVKKRTWSKPYREGYPVPQQPVIINQYGHDYRSYPGYYGYYPIGVWPMGYGARYGCVSDEEQDLEKSPPPSPAPTVTVTAPPSLTFSAGLSGTPTATPR